MKDLYNKPGHIIRRAHQISTAIFTDECAEFDLTSVQYAALVAIRENPNVDATRVSMLIAFDRSTIGGVLERLEGKGWILRSPDPHDKRIKLLRLSAAGKKVLSEVEPAVTRVQERLLAPLSANERDTLMRLLALVAGMEKDGTASAGDE